MSEFSESVDLRTEAREKSTARGYIPPGFLRSDMGLSEYEILLSRMIDRSIRPLFGNTNNSILSKNYQIQVTSNLLSCDETYCTQALAINAVSASIHMSGIPWDGPIAAVRVAYIATGTTNTNNTNNNDNTTDTNADTNENSLYKNVTGELVCNPTKEEMSNSLMNLIYVGLKDGKCLMIETDAQQIDYNIYKEALYFASKQVIPIKYNEQKIDLNNLSSQKASAGETEGRTPAAVTEKPVEIITTQHGMLSSMNEGMTKEETELQFKNEILDIRNKIYNDSSVKDIINEFNFKFKQLYGDTTLGKHDRLPTMDYIYD